MFMDAPALIAEIRKLAFSFGDNNAFQAEALRLVNNKQFSKAVLEWSSICKNGKYAKGAELENFNSLVACFNQVENLKEFCERLRISTSALYDTLVESNLRLSHEKVHPIRSAMLVIYQCAFSALLSNSSLYLFNDKHRLFTANSAPVASPVLLNKITELEATIEKITARNAELEEEIKQLRSNNNPESADTDAKPAPMIRRSARRR